MNAQWRKILLNSTYSAHSAGYIYCPYVPLIYMKPSMELSTTIGGISTRAPVIMQRLRALGLDSEAEDFGSLLFCATVLVQALLKSEINEDDLRALMNRIKAET